MENAAKNKRALEGRLQAAIAAGKSADEVQSIKEQGIVIHEARRGPAEIELKRQNIFLKWIDKQLPIIAFEFRPSGIRSEIRDDHKPSLVSTHLGKRKRSTKETTDRAASHWKLPKSSHAKDSCRKVEVDNTPDSAVSLVINTDSRDSTVVDQPQRSVHGSHLPKGKRIANSRREAAVPNLAATSLRAGGSLAVPNDQPIEKRVAALLDSHASEKTKPFQKRPLRKPVNSSRGHRHAKQATF